LGPCPDSSAEWFRSLLKTEWVTRPECSKAIFYGGALAHGTAVFRHRGAEGQSCAGQRECRPVCVPGARRKDRRLAWVQRSGDRSSGNHYVLRQCRNLPHADYEEMQQFFRLFMAPGVEHCGGGSAPQPSSELFKAVVNWVERGDAPRRILASQTLAGDVERTRPWCPYPAYAKYKGKGDTNEAASFDCVADLIAPDVRSVSAMVRRP
jgi:hypothetical protein